MLRCCFNFLNFWAASGVGADKAVELTPPSWRSKCFSKPPKNLIPLPMCDLASTFLRGLGSQGWDMPFLGCDFQGGSQLHSA